MLDEFCPASSPMSSRWVKCVRVFMPISRYDDCGQTVRVCVCVCVCVCVRASAVEYKGYLIEAFEERPRRWFANVRRLDGQAIPGMKSHSLRTSSVRFSKGAAIEFAKKVIDALPLV
jgi:hypothetical protein